MLNRTAGFAVALLAFALLFCPPSKAAAQVEVEMDPLAYALNGFSLHVAKVLGSTRLNVGTFGIDVPEFFHGNDGWTSSMRGGGVKWDYIGATPDGWFAGLDGGYMRARYTNGAAAATEKRDVIGLGVRAGYRLPIGGAGLYVAPWMSVSYNFDGADVVIDEARFDRSRVVVFPTVHIGWRF